MSDLKTTIQSDVATVEKTVTTEIAAVETKVSNGSLAATIAALVGAGFILGQVVAGLFRI